ncbi:MAG: endolytic transglycosylase MltG [Candidatus Kerfeldbacteria bacterium]|nr:endolytic transglycosylase MltG [Candidatus Kerfeldbacteria bacterium]
MRIVLIALSAVTVAALAGGWWFNHLVSQPLSSNRQAVMLTIAKGEGVKAVADKLYASGLIKARWHWNLYIALTGRRAGILGGEYTLRRDQSIRDIARLVTTPPDTTREVTIKLLEGWTAEAMADVLDRAGVIDRQAFLAAVAEPDTRQVVGDRDYSFLTDKPATAGLEGFLFPDTYRFFLDSTPGQVIGKLLDNFDQKYSSTMRQAVVAQGRSTFEVVILASIVERELKTDQDRAMAADIFLRRRAAGIPLQSDATVNFVTGKSLLRPTAADLDIDSPYNTYRHQGFPPGPISNPGLSALRAAVNPEPNPYYYFLTDPKGQTHFARTLDEHNRNKAQYLQ